MQVTDVTTASNQPVTGKEAGRGLNSVIHMWTVRTSVAVPSSPQLSSQHLTCLWFKSQGNHGGVGVGELYNHSQRGTEYACKSLLPF